MEIQHEEEKMTNLTDTLQSLTKTEMKPIQNFSATRLADGSLKVHNKTEAEQEEIRIDYPETKEQRKERENWVEKDQRLFEEEEKKQREQEEE